MTANPRKFSEKIALQQQKQAEGTAAYEQIMREVLATTRLAVVKPMQPRQDTPSEHHNHPNGAANPIKDLETGNSINLKNALMNLEDIKHSIEKPQMSYSPNLVNVMGGHSREQSPMRHLHPQQHSKRKKFSADRHREFSPYAPPHLLTLDPGWRRVSSDSAIHATVHRGRDGASLKVMTPERKSQEAAPNQNANILIEKNLRPRSCEMTGLSMNGYTGIPQQFYPNASTIHNTLGIPSQVNANSGSLPNIKSSAMHNVNGIPSDHSKSAYAEGNHCSQALPSHPVNYMPMGVRSAAGGNLLMQPGTGAICLGSMPQQGSYLESLYGASSGPIVGSMPSQNGHFILHQPNFMMPSNLPTNQVIGYQEVAPPPYPYPKSSSLPPTSPPPSITLTDVGCPGRPLETILLESPAEDMYSPSWERFLQSPPGQTGSASPSSRYMMSAADAQSGTQLSRPNSVFPAQVGLGSEQLNYPPSHSSPSPLQVVSNGWTGTISSNSTNVVIGSQNHVTCVVNSVANNVINNTVILDPGFNNPSMHIFMKNEPPPPYESVATHGGMVMLNPQNSGVDVPLQTASGEVYAPSRRNQLMRQEALMPQNFEDFPSLSCLGDSFEDVELMNAEDLKLEPLEIEDLNLLATLSCNVTEEEFFSMDKNC